VLPDGLKLTRLIGELEVAAVGDLIEGPYTGLDHETRDFYGARGSNPSRWGRGSGCGYT